MSKESQFAEYYLKVMSYQIPLIQY